MSQTGEDTFRKRPAEERGVTESDWLTSYHTFSFGRYRDPDWTRWGPLRVLNEDEIDPGNEFPPHDHEQMVILTYPLSGAVEHRDSSGGGGVIETGQIQRMTAGTGITHSEANASDTDMLHLLQIWIVPGTKDLEPSYETRTLRPREDVLNELDRIGSSDPGADAVHMHQDVDLYRAHLEPEEGVSYELATNRLAWLQVASGSVEVEDVRLTDGDGLAIDTESTIHISATSRSHVLFFDLPTISQGGLR